MRRCRTAAGRAPLSATVPGTRGAAIGETEFIKAAEEGAAPTISEKATGGVVYMAKGAYHDETPDGEIVMRPSAQTKKVKEPPHWMLLTPMDPAATGIPTHLNAGGSYIMFAGTPYAHLMIHQDPKMLEK